MMHLHHYTDIWSVVQMVTQHAPGPSQCSLQRHVATTVAAAGAFSSISPA